jgi:hypothetical protein
MPMRKRLGVTVALILCVIVAAIVVRAWQDKSDITVYGLVVGWKFEARKFGTQSIEEHSFDAVSLVNVRHLR